jgi:hypothetical protein
MQQVIVTIDKKDNLSLFLQFLKALRFVKEVSIPSKKTPEPTINFAKHPNVEALFGANEGKEMNLGEIRQKSWR